jgi:ribonuclease Z
MRSCRFVVVGILVLTLFAFARAEPSSTMQLVLLGTGYPYPSADRAGPSCAIIAGDKIFVVDAGRGVGMRLATMGNPWQHISAVFITHLHSDHIDGLPDLFHNTWQFGNGRPLELYGPTGIRRAADGILQFYEADIHIRRDLTEKIPSQETLINAHDIQEGVIYDKGGVRVIAFAVDHHPVKPAFGFRLESGEHSIVISGDTRPNDNLVRHAGNADIFVCEAYAGSNPSAGAEGIRPWSIRDYHTSAAEAGEMAEKAKVKTLVLTHLIPANAPDQYFLDEAKKAFSGKILVGRDLMRVDVSGSSNP